MSFGAIGSVDIKTTSTSAYLYTSSITDAGSTTVLIPQGTIVFHIHLISTATPSVLTISNGIGGLQRINVTGTASKGIDFDFGTNGISFNSGAYVTYDGNASGGVITCMASIAL
jgi:hypothetical protein